MLRLSLAVFSVWSASAACTSVSQPQDVVFVLDTSGSVGTDGWDDQIQFTEEAIMKGITDGSRVATITFDSRAEVWHEWNEDYEAVADLVGAGKDRYEEFGNTYTLNALKMAREMFEDNDHARKIVLITDGQPTDQPCLLEEDLAIDGITVLVVIVGNKVFPKLKCFENVIQADDFDQLHEKLEETAEELICVEPKEPRVARTVMGKMLVDLVTEVAQEKRGGLGAEWDQMAGKRVAAWSPGGGQDDDGEAGRFRYALNGVWMDERVGAYVVTNVQIRKNGKCGPGYDRVGIWANNGTQQIALCERREFCSFGQSYVSQIIAYTSDDDQVPDTLNGATLIGQWGNAWGTGWSAYTRKAGKGDVAIYQAKTACPMAPLPTFTAVPAKQCVISKAELDLDLNPDSITWNPFLPCPNENDCNNNGFLRGGMDLHECQWRCANTPNCVAAEFKPWPGASAWEDYKGRNCFHPIHGAQSEDCEDCGPLENVTPDECRAACTGTCNCTVHWKHSNKCQLRRNCDIDMCKYAGKDYAITSIRGLGACNLAYACSQTRDWVPEGTTYLMPGVDTATK